MSGRKRIRDTKDHRPYCDTHRKRQYATKKAAMSAMNSSAGTTSCKYVLKVYKCPDCRMWHLTKDKRNERTTNPGRVGRHPKRTLEGAGDMLPLEQDVVSPSGADG